MPVPEQGTDGLNATLRASRLAPVVEFENASVAFGRRSVWADATFRLAAGQFVGVIGPNGTGKTTLLRVLLGQVPVASGRVRVLGRQPGRGNPAIGYVPQRRTLASDLAVRGYDLVLLGLIGHKWGFGPSSFAERRAVEEALDAVGASATPTSRSACCPVASSSACSLRRRC